jgi:predicted Zn finger-like uncharacterized protein
MANDGTVFLVTCPHCGTANRVPASREGQAGRCGNCQTTLPMLHTTPVPLTDRSFDPFLNAFPGPVLAEFWAPW